MCWTPEVGFGSRSRAFHEVEHIEHYQPNSLVQLQQPDFAQQVSKTLHEE